MEAKKIRLTSLVRHILEMAVAGAEDVISMTAPGALRTHNISSLARQGRNQRHYINKVTERLRQRGYVINVIDRNGRRYLKPTPHGQRVLDRYQMGEITIKQPKRWSGEYHVIIFDIKEKRRHIRDGIRLWLSTLGFVRLQNSVWVYPYPCAEIIAMLKTRFGIGKDLLYLVVKSIENDRWLKHHFNLS